MFSASTLQNRARLKAWLQPSVECCDRKFEIEVPEGCNVVVGDRDRHGGTIWVESKEGSGTTFYFSLPINQEKEVGRSETGKPARS